jgi:nitrilase
MSSQKNSTVKVAAIQATPVLFDLEKSLDKVLSLVSSASQEGADLIVFPESFIPAYPRNMSFGTVVGNRSNEGRKVWQLYFDNSVEVPGNETELIARSAKRAGAYVSVGVTEKDGKSLFCTQLFFSPEGRLAGKHRKIKPTAAERVIWAEGDGSDLTVFETSAGRIGTLTCWENYMPLARMAMYLKGISIHLAPTADNRDSWQNTIRHIALEGRCFVISCNQYVRSADYPPGLEDIYTEGHDHIVSAGGTAIISPFGDYLAGPVWDKEAVLYANLDLSQITRASFDFDPAGHYNRNDIFDLSVKDQPDIIKC